MWNDNEDKTEHILAFTMKAQEEQSANEPADYLCQLARCPTSPGNGDGGENKANCGKYGC